MAPSSLQTIFEKKVLWDILCYQGQTRIFRPPATPGVLLAVADSG